MKANQPIKVRIGSPVFYKKEKIGRIHDVIGPVSAPWILIELNKDKKGMKNEFLGKKITIKNRW